MFTMTVPPEPPVTEPTIVAQASNVQHPTGFDYVIRSCQEVEHASSLGGNGNVLSPQYSLARLLKLKDDAVDSLVRLETPPEHGELRRIAYTRREQLPRSQTSWTTVYANPHGDLPAVPADTDTVKYFKPAGEQYRYITAPGYHGRDQAVFSVEYRGKRYRIDLEIRVYNFIPQASEGIGCPAPRLIKIVPKHSGADSDNSQVVTASTRLDQFGDTLAGEIKVAYAALGGATLAQVTGTAPNATITLDTNAAGHGWYVDYTPYLNEEYLPTSNPNLWVAKEGSEAAGKMDLLSVLLHEYGHALGIEHSTDSGDYMAATLQPGVRRLPSSEELALMARLVAEAKAKASYEVAAVDEVPQPGVPLNPDQPGAPLPSRNGSGGGNVRTTRARISRFGTTILNTDGSEAQQYSIVANPTMTDAKLQTGSGWETQGNVAIGNGAAVLSESATRQTRLNQVFTVGPNDRYLSFTLADIALDDITNGPDDAFEVGLLNADTGASLAGATGLSRNDAFLNLQANGTEFRSEERRVGKEC